MIAMAMMSSTIAIASRNSRAPVDTRSPSSASTPIGERDVGGRGDRPARGALAARGDQREQRDRERDTADRRDRRQRGRAPVSQLTDDQLALDLEPDDEEEHRHQRVVDPVVQVQRPVAIAIALIGTRLPFYLQAFMAWFGPKGVPTMAFSLLVLAEGFPGAERIFNLAALCVFTSILAHGLSRHAGVELGR